METDATIDTYSLLDVEESDMAFVLREAGVIYRDDYQRREGNNDGITVVVQRLSSEPWSRIVW